MPYDVDFKEIATTPILDVAAMLGITALTETQATLGSETVTQFYGQCPISKSKNASCFKITPKINRFVCFCDICKKQKVKGGDCIEMVCRVRGVERMEAAKEIKQHFSGADKADAMPEPKQEASSPSQASGFDPLKYLSDLDPLHEELQGLGISPETLRAFKAGYCKRGQSRGRLSVAICGLEGEIKAFVSTPIADDGELLYHKKYVPPFFMGCQFVGAGPLHLFKDIKEAMHEYENGVTNLLIQLRPITADMLKCLWVLMEDRQCTTLEICY